MSTDPIVTATQREDGFWTYALDGITTAALASTEVAALNAGRSHVHRNWHRSDVWPFEAPANCERGACGQA